MRRPQLGGGSPTLLDYTDAGWNIGPPAFNADERGLARVQMYVC